MIQGFRHGRSPAAGCPYAPIPSHSGPEVKAINAQRALLHFHGSPAAPPKG